MKKNLTIISKPTHACNLSCKYCYVGEGAEKGIMTIKTVDKSFSKIAKISKNSNWIWHGGEPLLMGVNFFKEVKSIQKFYENKSKHSFSNGIQTNGTLISQELLDFIKETRDFNIGISLDGPKKLNDKTRIMKNGEGAYTKIIGGIELMKMNRIGVGAICVINKNNINSPQELYDFFKFKKIHVKFNPLIKAGHAKSKLNELGITPIQYSNFLSKIFDIYNKDCLKDGCVKIEVSPIIEAVGNVLVNNPIGCNYSNSCRDDFFSIGPLGDVYPCGRFDGEKEFWMGNINQNPLEKILNSKINLALKKRNLETSSSECKSCDVGNLCNSGCMHNAYLEGDIMKKDPYCVAYKSLYKKVSSIIDNKNG